MLRWRTVNIANERLTRDPEVINDTAIIDNWNVYNLRELLTHLTDFGATVRSTSPLLVFAIVTITNRISRDTDNT